MWEMFLIKGSFNIIAMIVRSSFLKVTQEKSQGGWNPPAASTKEPLPVLWLTCVSHSSSLQWSLAKAMKSSLLKGTEQLKMTENGNKERFQQQHFPFITELPFIFLALFYFAQWDILDSVVSSLRAVLLHTMDGAVLITLCKWAHDSTLSKKWISMQDVNTSLN